MPLPEESTGWRPKVGQRVALTFGGRTVEATVVLASANGRSLFLEFEAVLGGYAGKMPVLQEEGGEYRDLVTGSVAQLAPLFPPARPAD